jgi:hypothetical protein
MCGYADVQIDFMMTGGCVMCGNADMQMIFIVPEETQVYHIESVPVIHFGTPVFAINYRSIN